MLRNNYKLILSDNFKRIIRHIKSPISKKFLFLDNNDDYGYPMSYIDIVEDDINMISYTPSKIVIKEDGRNIWNKSRNQHRIGRFISKYLENDPKNIEDFINEYKAELKSQNNFENFEIVEGDSVKKYYHGNSYMDGGGTLNKSCMRHDHCQPYFDFYSMNSDKIKMVVLYGDNKDKIYGRAILWDIDDPNIKLLDRIYTVNDSDQNLFIKLANKKGWFYKKTQGFEEEYIVSPDGKASKLNCKIHLKDVDYNYYPYLDTFYFFDKKYKYITNNKKEFRDNKYTVKLRSTKGTIQENPNFCYDDYNKDYIKVDDSVFCDIGQCNILKRDAIKINGKYARPDYVVYSEYDNSLYPKDAVMWSNIQNSFISKRDSFTVYLDKNNKKFDIIHSDFKGEKFEFVYNKNKYYMKDIIIKGFDNNYYLKDEYNEKEIKKAKEKEKERIGMDEYFSKFVKYIHYENTMNIDSYGTFYSTDNATTTITNSADKYGDWTKQYLYSKWRH